MPIREKYPNLQKKLYLAEDAVNLNILLIEDVHYKKLLRLIRKFEQFHIGKANLVDLKHKRFNDLREYGINESEIRYTISENESVKKEYNRLILKK